MNEAEPSLTEERLTALLQARADRVEVHPHLGGTSRSATDPVVVSHRARLWGAAAAALVVVAGSAILLERAADSPSVASAPGGLDLGLVELAAPTSGDQLLVWMEVQATTAEVQAVALALNALPEVDRYRYSDRDATYQEFVIYFADEPEILELVTPEQLPTYFRVDTTTPDEVADAIDDLPGVDAVEAHEPGDV